MQSQISESSERSTSIKVHDVSSVAIRQLSNEKIISLCSVRSDTTNYNSLKFSVFSLSSNSTNNIEIGVIAGLDSVISFRVYENYIIFCGVLRGTANNLDTGFIACASVIDLFGGGQYELHKISSTTAVYDLEVYKSPSNGQIKVAALGKATNNKYCIIDYDIFDSSITGYDIYETPNILYRIAQTDKYLAVVYSLPSSWQEFGIIRHDKGNLALYSDQSYKYAYGGRQFGYSYPMSNTPTFLIEAHYDKNNVFVATVLQRQKRPDVSGNECSVAVFKVDLDNNFNLDFTQILPTSTKSFVWDMKYSKKYNKLYLLADHPVMFSGILDVVCHLDMGATSNYICRLVVPNSSTGSWHRMNGIALYDNDYYVVAGRNMHDSLYWFDKFIPGQNPLCASMPKTDIYFDPPLPNGPLINYSFGTDQKMQSNEYIFHITTSDTVTCYN